jgi:hypothetical protein
MVNCGQACPYNTLDGCKVKEYNAICPLTNIATPITEYRITNADRIRAMSDEELAHWICKRMQSCASETCPGAELCNATDGLSNGLVKWLKQPAED